MKPADEKAKRKDGNREKGKVYLVGAGPGDPRLITVKGNECITKADTIVYDGLVNTRLLAGKKPEARVIFAGKSPQQHTMSQDEINRVLVAEALEGRTVVRLKGGDPFVFGRGGEEAEALLEAGITFEVVPGITSAVAVPAYAGIPVTHRDFTSTFTVVTGHEDPVKESSRLDWPRLGQDPGTLVFLMGMGNLPLIVGQLTKYGKAVQTPIALIRWGTTPEQQVVTGVLDNIIEKAREAGITSPAVIVVGEVVRLRDKLSWFERNPLFGQRVLVTRSREQAGHLSRLIEELGGEAVEFPAIRIADPLDYEPLDQVLRSLSTYHWLLFTSVNGVEFFFRRLRLLGLDIRSLGPARIGAIGPKTAEALESKGLQVSHLPEEFRAEALVECLGASINKRECQGQKVLVPRGNLARPILVESLRAMGLVVDEVEVYRTLPGTDDGALLKDLLTKQKISIVTFTSSSTVKNFLSLLGNQPRELLKGVTVACIGPVTAATAREEGLEVKVTAQEYTMEGLVKAVVNYVTQ